MQSVVLQPPLYFAPDNAFIWSTCFHPSLKVLACSLINGQIHFSQQAVLVKSVQLFHAKANQISARQCCFNESGTLLASCCANAEIGFIDERGEVVHVIADAHKHSINRVAFATDNIVLSGDDYGEVKAWDLRTTDPIFHAKRQSETVTGIAYESDACHLYTSSLDGTIAVYDLKKGPQSANNLLKQSHTVNEELHSVALFHRKYALAPSSEGSILVYELASMDSYVDRITNHVGSVECMVKIDQHTAVSGAEDGFVRAVGVDPHQIICIVGQHQEEENFPVQSLSLSSCGNILASTSHDSSIKFYDVSGVSRGSDCRKSRGEKGVEIEEEINQSQDSSEEQVKVIKKRKSKQTVNGRQKMLRKQAQQMFFKEL